jgi:hypothetical protein
MRGLVMVSEKTTPVPCDTFHAPLPSFCTAATSDRVRRALHVGLGEPVRGPSNGRLPQAARVTPRWGLPGVVADAPGETWSAVDTALRAGARGLGGGSSLARLLQRRRDVRNKKKLPGFSVCRILSWADADHRRNGTFPSQGFGPLDHRISAQ